MFFVNSPMVLSETAAGSFPMPHGLFFKKQYRYMGSKLGIDWYGINDQDWPPSIPSYHESAKFMTTLFSRARAGGEAAE
jgi:hypothetical protein